jgi:hypothetical protein
MTLATAIDTLASVSVSGVTKSYSIDNVRGGVNNPDLPALIPLPMSGQTVRAAYGYAVTSFEDTDTIRHRLLVKPEEVALQGEAMALTVDLICAYKTALKTLVTHSGADEMTFRRYEAGIVEWGGVRYYGADFFVEVVLND